MGLLFRRAVCPACGDAFAEPTAGALPRVESSLRITWRRLLFQPCTRQTGVDDREVLARAPRFPPVFPD
jgi:hypothetical protein